jgi:hypothetical protein
MRHKLSPLLLGLGLALGAVGCGDECEKAKDVLQDKCGGKADQFDNCNAATKKMAECVNDHEDDSCDEILAACS